MPDNTTRRRFLQVVGASGISGFAGCNDPASSQAEQSPSATTRSSPPTTSRVTEETDRPTQTDTSDIDPVTHDKLVGAFYQPWYEGERGLSGIKIPGGWMEWTTLQPVLGEYDVDNREVVNQHLTWCLEHGINWLCINWSGNRGIRMVDEHFTGRPLAERMNISVYTGFPPRPWNYVKNDNGVWDFDNPQNRNALISDFQFFDEKFFQYSNYLHVDGRPVWDWYDSGGLNSANHTGDLAGTIKEAKAELGKDVYIIGDTYIHSDPGSHFPYTPGHMADVFDAITDNRQNAASSPNYQYYGLAESGEKWANATIERYLDWRVATEKYDLDFIPSIHVASNDDEKDRYPHKDMPNFPHDRERYRRTCRAALDHVDPDLDAVLIASFNEWPEGDVIEPTKSFGTTYLEITRDELARGTPNYVDVDKFVTLALDFNGETGRNFLLDRLDFRRQDEMIASYDIATREVRSPPIFLEGVFLPHAFDAGLDTIHYLGGPTGRTRILFEPSVAEATEAVLYGKPRSADLVVDISFRGTHSDTLTFNKPAPKEYRVSLTGG